MKSSIKFALCMVLACACVNAIFAYQYSRLKSEIEQDRILTNTVITERDNAILLAEQWEQQYRESLKEIAELKDRLADQQEENAELTHWNEEVSSAMDEMIYNGFVDLGMFKLTAYCACEKCNGKWAGSPTASGTSPKSGRTVAVDPKVIPLGSKLCIDGRVYYAEDTGSAVKGHTIDIFMDSHEEAIQHGVRYANVQLAWQ